MDNKPGPDLREYVPTDLVQSQIDAAVAAAYEDAADMAMAQANACSEWYQKTRQHANVYEQLPLLAQAIRARADTDALSERDAWIRAEALREAASVVEHFWSKRLATNPDDVIALIPADQEEDE